MELGWIDYSKEDRKKVLSVIDLLSEEDTLDELGIAPIRDGFANLFFPGTSTIQTRAKYFLIVPYALYCLSLTGETNPGIFLRRLDQLEHECGQKLADLGEDGAIGRLSISRGTWVKRPPSQIYWAGLRSYGIFTAGNMSIREYSHAVCKLNFEKHNLNRFGNQGHDETVDQDDQKAGREGSLSFWNLPNYPRDTRWVQDLTLNLSKEEAEFLKNQIEINHPHSLLAFILEHKLINLPASFMDLAELVHLLPIPLQESYYLAQAFSKFIYGAKIRYNLMLTEYKGRWANELWEEYALRMEEYAGLDLEAIFLKLNVANPSLRFFLRNLKANMLSRNITALDELIRNREICLKGMSRARLNRAGQFDHNNWFGGHHLHYRFGDAKIIIDDIFSGLEEKTC
ncbi:MAG: DUF6361 family protein [Bacillota bacterium]|nr:DUF6361 family protein [Bacillota bacterium]